MPAVKLRLEITAVDLHLFRDPRQTLEQGTRISTRLPYSQAILSVKPPSYSQRATALLLPLSTKFVVIRRYAPPSLL